MLIAIGLLTACNQPDDLFVQLSTCQSPGVEPIARTADRVTKDDESVSSGAPDSGINRQIVQALSERNAYRFVQLLGQVGDLDRSLARAIGDV